MIRVKDVILWGFVGVLGLSLAVTGLATLAILLIGIYQQFDLPVAILLTGGVFGVLLLYFVVIRWVESRGLADWNWRGEYDSELNEEYD